MSFSYNDVIVMVRKNNLENTINSVSHMSIQDITQFLNIYEDYCFGTDIESNTLKKCIFERRLMHMSSTMIYAIDRSQDYPDDSSNCFDDSNSTDDYSEYYAMLYKKVFSKTFSQWIIKTFPEVKNYWCDPDTSYQEDVQAFSRAVKRYIEDNIIISNKNKLASDFINTLFENY